MPGGRCLTRGRCLASACLTLPPLYATRLHVLCCMQRVAHRHLGLDRRCRAHRSAVVCGTCCCLLRGLCHLGLDQLAARIELESVAGAQHARQRPRRPLRRARPKHLRRSGQCLGFDGRMAWRLRVCACSDSNGTGTQTMGIADGCDWKALAACDGQRTSIFAISSLVIADLGFCISSTRLMQYLLQDLVVPPILHSYPNRGTLLP